MTEEVFNWDYLHKFAIEYEKRIRDRQLLMDKARIDLYEGRITLEDLIKLLQNE